MLAFTEAVAYVTTKWSAQEKRSESDFPSVQSVLPIFSSCV